MYIYVLRHGQTNYNLEGKFQGRRDIELIKFIKYKGKFLYEYR